ncbi:MAG: hypothetical protein Q8N22_00910 [bacterium]|nr:hypothetical protein [bacterium]
MEDKFKLGKKWFWIGAVSAVIFPLIGLIYGIALLTEKNFIQKKVKEAYLIIFLAVVLGVVYALIGSSLVSKGYQFSPTGELQSIPMKTTGGPKTGDVLQQK